jgi:hypothetical protein
MFAMHVPSHLTKTIMICARWVLSIRGSRNEQIQVHCAKSVAEEREKREEGRRKSEYSAKGCTEMQ